MSQAAVLIEEQPAEYKVHPTRTAEHLSFIRPLNTSRTNASKQTAIGQSRITAEICYETVKELRGKIGSCKTNKERALVASALKNAVSAWDCACERERIARGRPLPGVLKAGDAPSKKKSKPVQHTFAEIPPPVVGAQVSNISKNLSAGESSSGPSTPTAKETLTATPRQSEASSSGFGMTEPE